MFLRKLKLINCNRVSATARTNAHVVSLQRLHYSSPSVCQSLTTSKSYKRLSRADRKAAVESFITEYRAANAGIFPTLYATHKEVGGSYYVIRDIVYELKHKSNAPSPIVAKTLSEVSASVLTDASSQTLNDAHTHSHCQSDNSACNAKNSSSNVVADLVFQVDSPDTIETGSDRRQATVDSSPPSPDNLQGNNLVISATYDKRETEIAPDNEVDSKCDSSLVATATHEKTGTEAAPYSDIDNNNSDLPKSMSNKLEESLKNSETEEEENLTHLGSQESKEDHFKGAAVSNVLRTETRQISEKEVSEVKTREKSSSWSNILSFAKGFANFWRKG